MAGGMAMFASVLDKRMKEAQTTPMLLELASVSDDYSIVTDTFPQPIPIEDCMAIRGIGNILFPGDRVLLAWVQDDPIIIDVVTEATKILGGDCWHRHCGRRLLP